ncbi:hypothetical protein ADUPG1_013394 [Aduncisulcus paluster]|uniref:Uncharacterized protein n=1 Tax=Aduncisulcus paluster TaxID=2918883 RepID=A0ABQ5K2R2_9EUKA|nr:hypothetical protein ADUPG1_013394 [Aduncisulcus paluster]
MFRLPSNTLLHTLPHTPSHLLPAPHVSVIPTLTPTREVLSLCVCGEFERWLGVTDTPGMVFIGCDPSKQHKLAMDHFSPGIVNENVDVPDGFEGWIAAEKEEERDGQMMDVIRKQSGEAMDGKVKNAMDEMVGMNSDVRKDSLCLHLPEDEIFKYLRFNNTSPFPSYLSLPAALTYQTACVCVYDVSGGIEQFEPLCIVCKGKPKFVSHILNKYGTKTLRHLQKMNGIIVGNKMDLYKDYGKPITIAFGRALAECLGWTHILVSCVSDRKDDVMTFDLGVKSFFVDNVLSTLSMDQYKLLWKGGLGERVHREETKEEGCNVM